MTPIEGQLNRSAMRLRWGPESLSSMGRAVRANDSRRVLVITGRTIGARHDLHELLEKATHNRIVGIFTGVRQHSPVGAVKEAVEAIRTHAADCLLAVGGGSAMVTARAANIVYCEGLPVEDLATRYEGGRYTSPRLDAAKLPMYVVPTTPTTAASKAGSAVTRPGHGKRLALFDPKTRARMIAVHPDFVATAPEALVTSASLNTMCMALEGLLSTSTNLFSDAQLSHAVHVMTTLLNSQTGRGSPDRRTELVLAGIMAGDGSDTARGGVGAALSHTIGHRVEGMNGDVEAILLPHVLRRVAVTHPGREAAGRALSTNIDSVSAAAVPDTVAALFARLGVAQKLREFGLNEFDLAEIAAESMADFAVASAPGRPDADQLEALLRAAW